jgi:cobalt-zinc-cadmium resistance protein CzcA
VSNEEAARILHTVRKALLTVPEVRTTVSQAGPPEDGSDPKTLGMAEIYVDLKPAADWRRGLTREQLVEQVELAVGVLPGLEPSFSQPIRDNVLESTSQIDGQIVIQVAGNDLAVLRRLTESIAYEVKQVPGVFRAGIDRPGDQPQLAIDIDRERTARHGLQVSDVQDVIEAALAGKPATSLWEDERKVQVVVRLPPSRRAIATLGATPVATADGAYATLGDLADIRETSGATNITREGGRRSMAIGIFIKDRDMGSVVTDMQARVAQHVRLPRGYTVAWSGEFQNQERAMSRLATVAPVPLLLVLVLLVEAFRSFRAAVLILLTVPLAMAGGFIALWMLDIPLSVPAAVGFIVLSGLSMFNGVLMFSEFQKLRGDGLDAPDAARQGSVQRLRAVLMTALLAALGLLPMAVSHDIGSEIQRPLAIVVIGGLLSATLFTLAVLPVLYAAWFAPKPGTASEPEPQAGP